MKRSNPRQGQCTVEEASRIHLILSVARLRQFARFVWDFAGHAVFEYQPIRMPQLHARWFGASGCADYSP